MNHLNPSNPDPQHWSTVSPAIGRAMAQAALPNLAHASAVQPGTFAVRSATIRSPVAPISDAEYADAKKLMETLDENGASSLGAWVSYGLGTENKNLPGYVLLNNDWVPNGGLENFGRSFLPARHQATTIRAKET